MVKRTIYECVPLLLQALSFWSTPFCRPNGSTVLYTKGKFAPTMENCCGLGEFRTQIQEKASASFHVITVFFFLSSDYSSKCLVTIVLKQISPKENIEIERLSTLPLWKWTLCFYIKLEYLEKSQNVVVDSDKVFRVFLELHTDKVIFIFC